MIRSTTDIGLSVGVSVGSNVAVGGISVEVGSAVGCEVSLGKTEISAGEQAKMKRDSRRMATAWFLIYMHYLITLLADTLE
jgi:hypothetical protein